MRNPNFIMLLAAIVIFTACEKYKDPASQDLGLTNKYCNDPIAANYNHGFPGVPDNSVCVYATEVFEGAWIYQDSVFLPDLTFVSTQSYVLNFEAYPIATDTLRNRLFVSGFCHGNALTLTATRYGSALTDTLIEYTEGGQLFCATTDTVGGLFRVVVDSLSTSMQIQLTENKSDGSYLHMGRAVRQ